MKQLQLPILLAAIASMVSPAAAAPQAPSPEPVSIISLIATPERYDGQRVITDGFVSLEFEGSAVYLDRNAWSQGLGRNGVWVQAPQSWSWRARADFGQRYASVTGTFHADRQGGHMGLYSGRLAEIERITPLESRSDYQLLMMKWWWFDGLRYLTLGVAFVALVTGGAYWFVRRRTR